MRDIKLAILIPSRGNQWPIPFAMSYAALREDLYRTIPGIEVRTFNRQGAILPQLRNDLVEAGLDWGATHLLMLDDDHSFPRGMGNRLLEHDKDIVGVPYPKRELNPRAECWETEDCREPIAPDESRGLVQVAVIGTGLLLVKSRVFRAIPKPWFSFEWIPERNCFLGEDFYFCDKARALLGFGIYADLSLVNAVGHVGSHCFKFNPPHRDEARSA